MLIIAASLSCQPGANIFVSNDITKALIYFTPCKNSLLFTGAYIRNLLPNMGTRACYGHSAPIYSKHFRSTVGSLT